LKRGARKIAIFRKSSSKNRNFSKHRRTTSSPPPDLQPASFFRTQQRPWTIESSDELLPQAEEPEEEQQVEEEEDEAGEQDEDDPEEQDEEEDGDLGETWMGFGKQPLESFLSRRGWPRMAEPRYVAWVRGQPTPSPQLRTFLDWVDANAAALEVNEWGYEWGFEPLEDSLDGQTDMWRTINDQRRYPARYCFEWLESGSCSGCAYRHDYPPGWAEERIRAHQQMSVQAQRSEEMAVYDDGPNGARDSMRIER